MEPTRPVDDLLHPLADDDPTWLEPEDLTDEELRRGVPLHPEIAAAAQRRAARDRERWRRLDDSPLPERAAVTTATVGTLLRAVRWLGALNQRELASATGLARTSIERMESSENSDPRLSTLQRVVEVCGLELVVVDDEGTQLAVPYEQSGVRDAGDRALPAHLQTFDARASRWWGDGRYQRNGRPLKPPRYGSHGRPKVARRRRRPETTDD